EIVSRNSADVKSVTEQRRLTPEQAEQFAALGYIGQSGAAPTVNTSLDAKDYIEYWNDIVQVSNDVKDAHYTEALDLMQKMQAANAFPVAVQIFQARAYAGN